MGNSSLYNGDREREAEDAELEARAKFCRDKEKFGAKSGRKERKKKMNKKRKRDRK